MVKVIRNYEEYIENEMLSCTVNAYNKLQTVGNFKIGDTVKVRVDWVNLNKYRAKILGFQKNSNKIFCQLKWLGSGSDLYKKVGSLFAIDEVYKV